MSDKIRSFIAIELPEDVKIRINDYINNLKAFAPKLKWVKKDSLHITLKFLGEQPDQKIDQVIASLLSIKNSADPFRISINNFGSFPNEKRAKVFWLGIEATPRDVFFKLFDHIEASMEQIGFEREQRKFSPHLTLARVKFPENFSDLWNFIKENPFNKMGFEVNDFVLMRSILKPSGAEYRVIQKYPLHS